MIQRVPVDSSVLAAVGYDDATSTLEIAFVNGRAYRYLGVPSRVHDELMAADSHGEYFNSEIRDAGYELLRLS